MSTMEKSGNTNGAAASPAPVGSGRSGSLTNPNLSSTLSADYEALRNDLEQANELAADFQRQLAGKSNEFAHMKQVFEKTQTDLVQFQTSIVELRQERHRLANEAMRAVAFEMRLKDMTAERDRLLTELESARHTHATVAKKTEHRAKAPDALIARLTAKVESLKDQLAAARRAGGAVPASVSEDPELKSIVENLSDSMERLREIIELKPSASKRRRRGEPDPEDHIDITFGR